MSAEIASLEGLLALGNPEGEENPRRKRGKKRHGRRHGRRNGHRRGHRNPGFGGKIAGYGKGVMGVVKNYAGDVVVGALVAAGSQLLAEKLINKAKEKVSFLSTPYGDYGARAAVGIGATMLAKKFAGNKLASSVGVASAVLLGKKIYDEQIATRIPGGGGGAATAGTAGFGTVVDTPGADGLGAFGQMDMVTDLVR